MIRFTFVDQNRNENTWRYWFRETDIETPLSDFLMLLVLGWSKILLHVAG